MNGFLKIWITFLANLCQILAIQYTTLEESADKCALILKRDAEVSQQLLYGNIFGNYLNCITFDDVNEAYAKVLERAEIRTSENDRTLEHVAAIGQVLLDVSDQLVKRFNLNEEDVERGLNQIDASKTIFKDICPLYLSGITCELGKYRRHDGLCNNVQNPSWGATMTPFTRFLPARYSDLVSSPRLSITGNELPTPRTVSSFIHSDEGYNDYSVTTMLLAWGQFVDHDLTLMATPLDAANRNEPEECCNRPNHLKNPNCMEIPISESDVFYGRYGVRCLDFVRAFPAIRPNCRLGSRTPFNTLTSVIDGNTIYGVDKKFSRHLRANEGGLLLMNPAFEAYGMKELLPPKLDLPDEGCARANKSEFCFLAGEIRVNEQLVLTCIHTVMAREHNRIAKELSFINPHWSDEILYQETRRIVIAEIQHVTFNEFLPLILGKEAMDRYGLTVKNEDYWDGYDESENPGILDAFSAAAFRFGHSLLPTHIQKWSRTHEYTDSKKLSNLIRRPFELYEPGALDEYLSGLSNQAAQAVDSSVTGQVTNHLLQKVGNTFGLDLVAFNVQRGRDFGLAGYNEYRRRCDLPAFETFEEMLGNMPNDTVIKYATIYEHPEDIDLWSGGVSERHLPAALVGPTFACVIAAQMRSIRKGDRFWYELPRQPSSFTPEQLREIRKTKLSRIVCDNADAIEYLQIYSMLLPDQNLNPRASCQSSILPKLDLTRWKEPTSSSFQNQTETLVTRRKKVSKRSLQKNNVPSFESTEKTKFFAKPDIKPVRNDLSFLEAEAKSNETFAKIYEKYEEKTNETVNKSDKKDENDKFVNSSKRDRKYSVIRRNRNNKKSDLENGESNYYNGGVENEQNVDGMATMETITEYYNDAQTELNYMPIRDCGHHSDVERKDVAKRQTRESVREYKKDLLRESLKDKLKGLNASSLRRLPRPKSSSFRPKFEGNFEEIPTLPSLPLDYKLKKLSSKDEDAIESIFKKNGNKISKLDSKGLESRFDDDGNEETSDSNEYGLDYGESPHYDFPKSSEYSKINSDFPKSSGNFPKSRGGDFPKSSGDDFPEKEDEEADDFGKDSNEDGIIDVEHDAPYEYVPMEIDEFGRQTVKEGNEALKKPEDIGTIPEDFPGTYTGYINPANGLGDYLGGNENRGSAFKPKAYGLHRGGNLNENSDDGAYSQRPTSYRQRPTSHQFNSLADEKPHFFSHSSFKEGGGNEFRFVKPESAEHQGVTYRPIVPSSLEEYHRIHGTPSTPETGAEDEESTMPPFQDEQSHDDGDDFFGADESPKTEAPFEFPNVKRPRPFPPPFKSIPSRGEAPFGRPEGAKSFSEFSFDFGQDFAAQNRPNRPVLGGGYQKGRKPNLDFRSKSFPAFMQQQHRPSSKFSLPPFRRIQRGSRPINPNHPNGRFYPPRQIRQNNNPAYEVVRYPDGKYYLMPKTISISTLSPPPPSSPQQAKPLNNINEIIRNADGKYYLVPARTVLTNGNLVRI